VSAPTPTYAKVPFEWTTANEPTHSLEAQGVGWQEVETLHALADVVGQALAVSRDAVDSTTVAKLGAYEAAQRLLQSPRRWKCSYEIDWWKILTFVGEPAGFVLPVTYDEEKGSLGTIFHMGVVPRFRGLGLSRALLRETVTTLTSAGVSRIFCDTDASNEPMIRSFTSEGWTRLPVREVPMPLDFTPGEFNPGNSNQRHP
jgi:ribosomal protein S18 acetylase RimI-like enzyme